MLTLTQDHAERLLTHADSWQRQEEQTPTDVSDASQHCAPEFTLLCPGRIIAGGGDCGEKHHVKYQYIPVPYVVRTCDNGSIN